jgi:hypothetical protein
MTYFVETRWGGSEDSPSVERMKEILAELDKSDAEHPDTWLTHESGWTLSAHETGLLVWDHEEAARTRHMRDVPRSHVLDLWTKLSAGLVDEIEREPWCSGTGIAPPTDAEKTEHAAAVLEFDRNFYDSLGAERDDERCRAPNCRRGAVVASVFCRVHQFENVRRRPSPFTH